MSATLDLFAGIDSGEIGSASKQVIDLPHASIVYTPHLFTQETGDEYFQNLLKSIDWKQEEITFYGKTHNVPRLSAWYGDAGKDYTYSGIHAQANVWIQPLLEIKQCVEQHCDSKFNSVLVNLYRDGNDSVAWHSDDEAELGRNPVIASISLGDIRRFQMRMCDNHANKYSLNLEHGSCLLMSGETQAKWQHQVPKERSVMNPRINLTFRMIK